MVISQSADGQARSPTTRGEASAAGLLMRRFNGGDESAFTEIVGRYRERIQALASRFLRSHADAEETVRSLGINEVTVKSRLAGARGKLRRRMIESCPEFAAQAAAHDWFEPFRSGNSVGARTAA